MPHVSKEKLNNRLYEKLFTDLIELQVGLSKKQAASVMSSLLTETEQIMLTKRCAAAIMFEHGYSSYRVWTVLKISKSTAKRLREQYEEGVFDGLLRGLRNKKLAKKEKKEFIETFNKIMRLGMPSMGKDRWKSVFE
tara:strand:+ start:1762 stop:2172 length:411 start_codon:yes stop_codon:yes gene_type:complete